ncbi:MAG: glycosyltransferase [Thermodesulfobacteriota bacterium]
MGRKIKVFRIIARLNIGGPAIHTVLLTEGLDKDRFDSILLTGSVDDREGDMRYFAEERGVKPIFVSEMGREISLKNDLKTFWKTLKTIKKEMPDLIHTHTAKAGTIGRGAAILIKLQELLFRCFKKLLLQKNSRLAVRKSQLKIIHTFHGHTFHGYFNPFKARLFLSIERLLARFTDRIIVLSNQQFKELCYKYKIAPPDKFVIIPLGFDIDKFLQCDTKKGHLRKELGVDEQTLLVGIVGRLVPIKNHRMFLDAAAEVIKPETRDISEKPSVRFIIIGDGELRSELEAYTQKLGIEDDITFTGWREDLNVIYADLDIVALTSLNEGTPVSLIEAMASGKPIISTNTGGILDLVASSQQSAVSKKNKEKKIEAGINNPGYTIYEGGILVEPGDGYGFAEALKLLLSNKELRKDMGNEGRRLVREKYRKERLFRDIENLYFKVVNGESN